MAISRDEDVASKALCSTMLLTVLHEVPEMMKLASFSSYEKHGHHAVGFAMRRQMLTPSLMIKGLKSLGETMLAGPLVPA